MDMWKSQHEVETERLKEDRVAKQSKNRQDTLTRSPQNKINKRKRDQWS
jgi:hypothetical protein